MTEIKQVELMRLQTEERKSREEESGKIIVLQQEELSKARAEIEQSKQDVAKTQIQLKTISQTIEGDRKAPKDIVISSSDLSPYVTGIVQVICVNGSSFSSGSGSLFTFNEIKNAVLTNYHVVKDASRCVVIMTDSANSPTGVFGLSGSIYTFNKDTDEAILAIGQPLSRNSVSASNYNYSLSSLRQCDSLMPIGTPVVVIGFPAYAKRESTMEIETVGTAYSVFRTATNGIISGYDTSSPGNANYFVSAKIDSGNSGGMALAKDSSGICTLGLPTWLTVGNYETQGLVQNIKNVLPTKE